MPLLLSGSDHVTFMDVEDIGVPTTLVGDDGAAMYKIIVNEAGFTIYRQQHCNQKSHIFQWA